MRTPAAYERDPYRTELEAAVLDDGEDGGPYAILDDTILYPEGGGQPADRGFLGDVAVLDVRKTGEEIRHYLAAPAARGPVMVRLDWPRRFDHMQQHTGQHVLTAVAQERYGWETTAFHLGEERSDIELAVPVLAPADLEGLEEAVAAVIRSARTVSARCVSLDEYRTLRVRSRGLPEGHCGDVRLVEIEDLDLNTCGGTHVRNTAELECLKLLGTESLRGGTRLFFVVGGRVRRRLEGHERRCAALRTLLGAPDEGVAGAVEGKLEQLRNAERRGRLLEEDLARSLAEALGTREERLTERHVDGQEAGLLQKVARLLVASHPTKAAFLTASQGAQHFFVLAAGPQSGLDAAALGRELAAILEAKGGGAGCVFQGRAAGLTKRSEALERLRAALS